MINKICMIRAEKSGVHYGKVLEINGSNVLLENARRVWYWEGAASLSELAVRGTTKPAGCKFPCAVPRALILDVCEILEMTEEAISSLNAVPLWTAVTSV